MIVSIPLLGPLLVLENVYPKRNSVLVVSGLGTLGLLE